MQYENIMSESKRIVMKFGGTSVGNIECIRNAAEHIKREVSAGYEVAVVVSAMSGETNRLISLVRDIFPDFHHTHPSASAYDTILASGEQVSISLLTMMLHKIGIPARAWLGWQLPIETNDQHNYARITNIGVEKIEMGFARGEVSVIAGFQGVSPKGHVTTLGRGGSDTSGVAVAVALGAQRCDIYTDVDAVYTADPNIVPEASPLSHLSYEEMLELASLGAKVLQTRSVELAMKYDIPLRVRSSFINPMLVNTGTLICNEEIMMSPTTVQEQKTISGITYVRNEAKITLRDVTDKPGAVATIFSILAQTDINVDMIVQNISADQAHTDVTFTLPYQDIDIAVSAIQKEEKIIQYRQCEHSDGFTKISIVGIGMKSHTGVAETMFSALASEGINIHIISTSEIKISVLIDDVYTQKAIKALHKAYELE